MARYLGDSAGNNALPGVMALGYIGAFSETLALAVIAEKVRAHSLRRGGPARALAGLPPAHRGGLQLYRIERQPTGGMAATAPLRCGLRRACLRWSQLRRRSPRITSRRRPHGRWASWGATRPTTQRQWQTLVRVQAPVP